MRKTELLTAACFVLGFSGCAGTLETRPLVAPSDKGYQTACFLAQGGNSADMDQHLSRDLSKRGFQVTAKTAVPAPGERKDCDLFVTYEHDWSWDMTMYLKSLDITVYDYKYNTTLGTGKYRNSAFHGYPKPAEKIHEILDRLLKGARIVGKETPAPEAEKPAS